MASHALGRTKLIFAILGCAMLLVLVLTGGCTTRQTSTEPSFKGPVKMLDPNKIPKFKESLVIPPAMPPTKTTGGVTEYEIAARQFKQQVLPKGLPMTTVWGYGRAGDPLPGEGKTSTFNYPAFTIETRTDAKVRVKWINGLVDDNGDYLPPLTAVDQTIHWADPAGTAMKKTVTGKYTGPVPIITHVHGAHVQANSDGYPEAWYLPDAKNIPAHYKAKGPKYGSVGKIEAGAALFEYPNSQRATTLWYHDHTLGMTRNNVYSGLAGFWLIRDDIEDSLNLPGPAPKVNDPAGKNYYEIPLAIQDKSFNTDGSLFYPTSRAYFKDYKGAYKPETPVPPIWNPEFFGNAMLVNGRTWPYLEVEPRLYRFRLLNGCNSRFLIVKFDQSGLQFKQIGTEGGLLPGTPLQLDQLLIAPAERADVIVDFSGFNQGDEITLLNIGPDEPFKGPETKLEPADPETTGQVMKFKVVAKKSGGTGQAPTALPAIDRLGTTLPARELTINEEHATEAEIPVISKLGTGNKGPLNWEDLITETPFVGDTEIWQIVNLTEDAHPIHLHQVMFQVVDRQPIDKEKYTSSQEDSVKNQGARLPLDQLLTGPAVGPNPWETGWKDTVIANPGQVTRIIARFDIAGLYVWHCHVLEHEDNEMMRPYVVNNR